MRESFDYMSITPMQKDAAEECANIAAAQGNEGLSNTIKQNFGIIETPSYDLSSSTLVNSLSGAGIGCFVMGSVMDNNIKYPIVSIQSDIRQLDSWFSNIK